jgi:carbon storage regulator CsrA
MLVLTRQVGQSLIINDNITVTIISISGNNVKVGIEGVDRELVNYLTLRIWSIVRHQLHTLY